MLRLHDQHYQYVKYEMHDIQKSYTMTDPQKISTNFNCTLELRKKSHLVIFGIIRPKCRDKNGIRDEDITATVPATRTVFRNWFIRLNISPVFVLYGLFKCFLQFF